MWGLFDILFRSNSSWISGIACSLVPWLFLFSFARIFDDAVPCGFQEVVLNGFHFGLFGLAAFFAASFPEISDVHMTWDLNSQEIPQDLVSKFGRIPVSAIMVCADFLTCFVFATIDLGLRPHLLTREACSDGKNDPIANFAQIQRSNFELYERKKHKCFSHVQSSMTGTPINSCVKRIL
jgi:hypothetical protein